MKCTAHRTDGEPCKAWAIKGATVCRVHGGSRKGLRAAAARNIAEEKARKALVLLAEPVDIDPAQALIELVQWTAGEVRYWRAEVARIAEESPASLTWGKTREKTGGDDRGVTEEATRPVAYTMLTDAQDRLAKFAAAALRAGVEERRVRLAEDQGALVAQVIRRILDRLDLAAWQAELVPTVVPEELRALTAAV